MKRKHFGKIQKDHNSMRKNSEKNFVQDFQFARGKFFYCEDFFMIEKLFDIKKVVQFEGKTEY